MMVKETAKVAAKAVSIPLVKAELDSLCASNSDVPATGEMLAKMLVYNQDLSNALCSNIVDAIVDAVYDMILTATVTTNATPLPPTVISAAPGSPCTGTLTMFGNIT